MKTLVLLRHAKSSWKDASLPDRDRPLNDRGLRDAPRIGGALEELVGRPDLVVSSPAARALATARIVAEAVGFPLEAFDVDERIYGATPAELLKVIRGLDDGRNHVILVGHNPGFTELVNALSGPRIDNVPTCGAVELRITAEHWSEISPGTVRRASVTTPKGLDSSGGA